MKNFIVPQSTTHWPGTRSRDDTDRSGGAYRSASLAAVLLALFLSACGPAAQPASTPAPEDTYTPPSTEVVLTPDWTPTQAPTEELPPTQAITNFSAGSLSMDGPWLLLNTDQGLWVANPDGTGGTLINKTGPVLIPGSLQNAVSSTGGHIAFLTYSDTPHSDFFYRDLHINILTLPQYQSWLSLPLTSPQTEPSTNNPSDINRAMAETQSFAWSPEGERLAFIGATAGPSADLYEYRLSGGDVLRLTDGPDQAYAPVWSPDGTWIVQTAAAGFGTGAGISVTGIYAARADDSGVISLYDIPKGSGGEETVGWLNDHTLVSLTWFITCGPSDLRLTDLSSRKSDVVFKGCVTAAAVAKGRGSVLFAQSLAIGQFVDNPQPGMFILTNSDRQPRLVSNADIRDIAWSAGSGSYLASWMDGSVLFAVSTAGNVRNLMDKVPQIPVVSPDGRYWAWDASLFSNTLTGLWIGEYGRELRQIYPDEVPPANLLWAPDGQSLYFLVSAGSLYRAQAPDWVPTVLAENLKPGIIGSPIAWVAK